MMLVLAMIQIVFGSLVLQSAALFFLLGNSDYGPILEELEDSSEASRDGVRTSCLGK